MRISRTLPIFAAALVVLPCCGKKGPLLAPLSRIPQKVEAVALLQRGDSVVLEWTNPSTYADGSPLSSLSEVEIRLLKRWKEPDGERPTVTPQQFEREAGTAVLITKEEFSRHLKNRDQAGPPPTLWAAIPVEREEVNRMVFFFGLRTRDERGKASEFSALWQWDPLAVPLPPAGLQARRLEDRIEVRWEPPSGNTDGSAPAVFKGYNIYRAAAGKEAVLVNPSLLQDAFFEDKDFVTEAVYRYFVRAAVSEAAPYSESGDSASVEVEARDTFAPAVPAGLKAVPAAGLITLVWDANRENDLAGYRVWRRDEGKAEFVLLTPQAIAETVYTDTAVEKNVRHEYAISAMDRSGNESRKSESVRQIIKDEVR